jgi:chaperonin cofactor prefoldin
MIELLFAVAIGMILGYLLKKEQQPPVVDILNNQVEHLEKEVKYYKDLCKWHAERNKHE